MLDDKSLLELCLKVSGGFEGTNGPSYTSLTGNFDGMGMSVGILQWNAGMGTLQTLLQSIGTKMGWDKAQTFFSSDIHHLAVLTPKDAIQFCLDHYIASGSTHLDPGAAAKWVTFLSQPESIAAQVELATNGVLARAKTLVKNYCVGHQNETRPYAFFFDLVTQSGGMQNAKGKVDEYDDDPVAFMPEILAFVQQKSPQDAAAWKPILDQDMLARLLMYYAYKRSLLSNPAYVWDALSRRGAIACRTGIVHGRLVNFNNLLD
jgi:hypothetical protein